MPNFIASYPTKEYHSRKDNLDYLFETKARLIEAGVTDISISNKTWIIMGWHPNLTQLQDLFPNLSIEEDRFLST